MRHITVHFEDGNTIDTSINGTNESILKHYIGVAFDFGDSEEHPTSKMVKAIRVEFHLETRKQYMDNEINHHDYYSQFVSKSMIRYVVRSIGADKIKESKDPHMNDIPIRFWDSLQVMPMLESREDWKTASLSTYSKEEQEKRTYLYSQADQVCLAKAAARIYLKEA